MRSEASNGGSAIDLVVALGLAAIIALAGRYWISTQRAFDRADAAAPTIFSDPEAKQVNADAILATQKRELAWRPLSQNALNRLLVAARLSGQKELENNVAAIMRDFAWRTAPGQLNLINIAIERHKFAEVFQHADALTRRGKAVEEFLAIFTLYEQLPDKRADLIAALKRNPPWREAFLASAERLKTVEQVEARYATVTALLSSGSVKRKELTPLVSRLVTIGSPAKAYALWAQSQRVKPVENMLYDSGFIHASALQRQAEQSLFPFEWQLDTGRNAGTQLIERGGQRELQLYWNGQGVPIFAKQTFRAQPGVYRLTLAGVEANPAAQRTLAAELLCDGKQHVRLLPVPAARKDELAYRAEGATRCNFPELRLFTVPDSNGADFEMSLTSIKLDLAD